MDRVNQKAMNQSHQLSGNIAQKIHTILHPTQKQPKIDYPRNTLLGERRSNKKQLRFAEISTLILTQPKTESEMALSWYNKQDFRQFKTDTKKTSQVLSGTRSANAMTYIGRCIKTGETQAELALNDVHEIRGLEHLVSPKVCRVLIENRREAIASVLLEQARQEEVGSYDAEKIASVSRASSEFATEWRRRIVDLQLDQ